MSHPLNANFLNRNIFFFFHYTTGFHLKLSDLRADEGVENIRKNLPMAYNTAIKVISSALWERNKDS